MRLIIFIVFFCDFCARCFLLECRTNDKRKERRKCMKNVKKRGNPLLCGNLSKANISFGRYSLVFSHLITCS